MNTRTTSASRSHAIPGVWLLRTLGAALLLAAPSISHAAAPVFESSQRFPVHQASTNGTVVGTVVLTLTNEVVTPLTYDILAGNELGVFEIQADPEDVFGGQLRVADAAPLAGLTNGYQFDLQLSVTNADGADTNFVAVNVYKPAAFLTTSFEIPEKAETGTVVGTVLVDYGTTNVAFGVDTNSEAASLQTFALAVDGTITVVDSSLLDYEQNPSFTLGVVVTNLDSAARPELRITYSPVTIALSNVNEAPYFAAQAFTTPSERTNTYVGTLDATDPEGEGLVFEIVAFQVDGAPADNDYFTIRNGNELHLISPVSSGLLPPTNSVLTIRVTETERVPALASEAPVTVVAPKTYSFFGVPLLVPIAGHDGGVRGFPVQAMATGPNGEIYVVGHGEDRSPYLDLYAFGFDAEPSRIPLETGLTPTAVVATADRIYVAGSMNNGSSPAKVYRYATDGTLVNSVVLSGASYSWVSVTDMLVDGASVYICGSSLGFSPWWPWTYQAPFWAELNSDSLSVQKNVAVWYSFNAPDLQYVTWGTATAITKEPGQSKVYVAGHWNFHRFWKTGIFNQNHHHRDSLSTFICAYQGTSQVNARTSWTDRGAYRVIKDLAFVEDQGSSYVYALEQFAWCTSMLTGDAAGYESVVAARLPTSLVNPAQIKRLLIRPTAAGYVVGGSMAVSQPGGGEEPALYVTGVVPGGIDTVFDDGLRSEAMSPGANKFFVAKVDLTFQMETPWVPPLILSDFNYTIPGGPYLIPSMDQWYEVPKRPFSAILPYPAKEGIILGGNLSSGTLSLAQNGSENSVIAQPGRNAGFLTVITGDKRFIEPVFLEVRSQFGRSGVDVLPHAGKRVAVQDMQYTVAVPPTLYVGLDGNYLGNGPDHRPTDQEVATNAVTRYVCTGYTVENTQVIGNSSSYTFVFRTNTTITFHWQVEHALEIKSDLSGTGAVVDPLSNTWTKNPANGLGLTTTAGGNPEPSVQKHWIKEDELATATVDGSVMDLTTLGTRYVVTGYRASGAARGSGDPEVRLFPAIETRQKIDQFVMRAPAKITYTWGIQHRVQVSTSSLTSQGYPAILLDDASQRTFTGSGEFWFDRGSPLLVGAEDVSHSLHGALLATGDLLERIPNKQALTRQFNVGTRIILAQDIASLLQGTTVLWDYGDPIYRQTVAIGNPVQLYGQAGELPPAVADQINTNREPRARLIESPPGTTGDDMHEWDQVARRCYPVRPGRFFLDWEKRNSAVDKDGNPLDFVILEITSEFPPRPHYPHTTHPDMPAVPVDPEAADDMAFLELEFTTGDGAVSGGGFTARQTGRTVLLFSRSDPQAVPFVPAAGDRLKETLVVRVVRTTSWDDPVFGLNTENPPDPTPAFIGTKLDSRRDFAELGTGFVVYTNAFYNSRIYDRRKVADAGPIIPVNRNVRTNDLTRDLVVVWYQRLEHLLWPSQVERFRPQWPVVLDPAALPQPLPDVESMSANGTNYLRRIVVASRLGSEGKDHALRDQLSFSSDRYDQVAIYHQPDASLPGYNPNEEHALIAPSFKFLDQANPPPVVYALRHDLNRTSPDDSHTSDPYVLVQYLDRGTNFGVGEFKMAVYAVEMEDDRPQLNPDRDPAIDPDPDDPTDQREFPYTFHYTMEAGEPVQPPYPLGLVIGAIPCRQTRGENLTPGRVYWEDYRGQPWAVSDGDFHGYFYYPLLESFWDPTPTNVAGTPVAFETGAALQVTGRHAHPVFRTGDSLLVQDAFVALQGTNAADFVAAINTNPQLAGRVLASLLETGEIRLRAVGTNSLRLHSEAGSPVETAGLPRQVLPTPAVRYTAVWPDDVAILKAGETLTFAGGEYKADHPGAETPGLPGVVGWASGDLLYDSLNPTMNNQQAFTRSTVRLVSPLEERTWQLSEANAGTLREKIQPATGITQADGVRWRFPKLSASLGRRVFYDPFNRQLGIKGFLNDKTLGDSTLTATPPPVYVLEPNILTPTEKEELSELLPSFPVWQQAVEKLYEVCRNPQGLRRTAGSNADAAAYYVGLESDVVQEFNQDQHDSQGNLVVIPNSARPRRGLGPGLALVPNAAFLDPAQVLPESYVTLAENNDPDIGGPITLHIIKVAKTHRYRGAIKTILADNVFDERITLRHSGDFGGNVDDLVYQWFYREEDGTEAPVPPAAPWRLFPDRSTNPTKGTGMYQIALEGTGGLLLSDNLFFVRYRHQNDPPLAGPNSLDWTGTEWDRFGRFDRDENNQPVEKVGTHWAGAANSPTVDGLYRPQLAMGWVKRVLDRVNLFEARIDDFRTEAVPATYASMIQSVGQRYEGPVALNPDKDVIENVGLIELYETVLSRSRALSIDLSSPVTTPGINNALLLAATRLSDFYMLLGNEAYADAQTPTIGFGDDHMDFAGDYGSVAASMFAFQNQVPSLLEEELALLRGVPESYGRPVYNRLFWNFTKSLGEVAYAVGYDITDYNRDGFVDESDAMALYPQGHGDAWGHYLTAVKTHYRLLQHPYYNWVSRAERYNLLDVVLDVDYLDERKFAEAAAARAKCGAEIVNLTYRARYDEDPDGQWQGYADVDADRAWGVDGWARRAGQGALFDWITANALLPAQDTNTQHNALQRIDRTTVVDLASLSQELAEIQSQYDNANNGFNPLGLAPDVVPFDIDATFNAVGSTATIGRPTSQGLTHFQQVYERAVAAVANARTAFESANMAQNRQRQVVESVDNFRQETWEQDLDYRNRLIEVFGTPYPGQIGAGKAYPAGYYGPDLMLWMYVAVNDVSSETVPPASSSFTAAFAGFRQQMLGTPATDEFKDTISTYFVNDLAGVTNVGRLDLQTNSIVVISNLPATASGYTFRAPASWGQRASPGELQILISEMVQAEADLALGIADYDLEVKRISDLVELLAAKHNTSAEVLQIKQAQTTEIGIMNGLRTASRIVSVAAQIGAAFAKDQFEASAEGFPEVSPTAGMAFSVGDIFSAARLALKSAGAVTSNFQKVGAIVADKIADTIGDAKEIAIAINDADITYQDRNYELREKLKELEQELRNEALKRVEVFKRLEALRQISDRYRATLEAGLRLLQQRQVFNIKAAGTTQRARYQDMAFRVFRNDALQKYRAAFDLAARYTYMAAKAYDYETNLSPDDRGSAQGILTQIVRTRTLGVFAGDEPVIGGGGLSDALATLRDNFKVLEGRMSFNNPQYEWELISLRKEFFRIPGNDASDGLWRQTLKQYRVADLWQVPEFRRYCRPPAPRSAGALPGLVIPFGTEIVLGHNVFGWPLGGGDHAYDPSVFANKIQSAAVYLDNYPVASLAATPRVYMVPAGLDVMTIPTSAELKTREWSIVDQAIPVPYATGTNDLADPSWIPVCDGLAEPLGQIRRFSSFRAKDSSEFDPGADALSYDTRLIGRSVWNTRWLLIVPGGSLLADGDEGLDTLIDGTPVPGGTSERDLNGVQDILLLLHTYGYSGN